MAFGHLGHFKPGEELMDLASIKPKHVMSAMAEYRRIGHGTFLENFEFGEPSSRWLVFEGRSYPAKAIVGAAHGYARPDLGALTKNSSPYTTKYAERMLNQPKFNEFKLSRGTPEDPISPDDAAHRPFDPAGVKDTRETMRRAIRLRRGQRQFRDALIEAYEGRCAVTGCSVRHVLEAAHIQPYCGLDTNRPDNGLLLRSDMHTLFDSGLVAVCPDSMTVLVATELNGSEYERWRGRPIQRPQQSDQRPSPEALRDHLRRFGW